MAMNVYLVTNEMHGIFSAAFLPVISRYLFGSVGCALEGRLLFKCQEFKASTSIRSKMLVPGQWRANKHTLAHANRFVCLFVCLNSPNTI